jgi:uncharacterized repeat protein (TIGR01451 family)
MLSSYGNLSAAANVASGTDPSGGVTTTVTPHGGSAMLQMTESPHDGTPQGYIAYIENLAHGDVITATFWGWDQTPGVSPSLRIWAHYAQSGDVDSYAGSAGGNSTYTDGTGWSQLTWTWTFDSAGDTRDALVIEARLYSTPSSGEFSTDFWIDDLQVIAPDSAAVSFPAAGDLSISKTGPSTALPGDELVYEITLGNIGDLTATEVTVVDTLPFSITGVISSSNALTTTVMYDQITWEFGDLGVEAFETIYLTATVDSNAPVGLVLTNTASVTTTAAGDDPANNRDSVYTTIIPDSWCGYPATYIHVIQGSGMSSPEVGNVHTVEGVVVGDFQTSSHLYGFFLQEEDTDADSNPMTSEGIFIYDGSSPAVDVNDGDIVRVEGTVQEYFGLTRLTNVSSVEVCPGSDVASPAIPNMPVTSVNDWEWYEGMSVNITQTLYATDNYNQGRYGEVDLSIDSRQDSPTNVVEPGAAAIALQDLNDRSRIQMDDGRSSSNAVPPAYIGDGGTLRAGDTIPGLKGVLGYAYSAYEIHPTEVVSFTRVNARDTTPPAVGGTHKVASFNVLNYFTTLNDSGPICGPLGNLDCRGADNAAEFTRQRTKIITAIIELDADVVGLMEIENHPTDEALQDLVNGLNDEAGAGTYDYIDTGPVFTDAIKVAFIYKTDTITPVGAHAILDSSVISTFIDTKNRPVVAQTFADTLWGEKFTVAVNHLKSKGSDCDSLGDPDIGDGQGNCNLTRTSAAEALVDWLATDPTSSGDGDFLIIGDLNAYAKEDPVDAIKAGGYTDLLESSADSYTYVYYGQAGYLDHALANAAILNQLTGVTIWHINADEPSALDYNDYNLPLGLYNPDQYRSSDHDPVIVGLDLSVELPNASFVSNSPVTLGEVSVFTNTSTGDAPLTYTWDFGDEFTSTLESPTHTYTQTSTYTVTLTVTNVYGTDIYTDTHIVEALPVEMREIYLPMIFKLYED